MAVEKISELVWLYVKKRPFLQEVLRQKVVNYSSLARRIALEAFGSKKQIIAVKAALIRLSDRLAAKSYDMEEKVLSTLKGSSVNMQSKVSVVISSSELPVRPRFHNIYTSRGRCREAHENEAGSENQRECKPYRNLKQRGYRRNPRGYFNDAKLSCSRRHKCD